MYGLPKIHKDGCPLRSIMSAIGTFNYNLSKFLVYILSPITRNEFTVSDSFTFAKEICDLRFDNCILASFDIKSLFTNIPLLETIDICINTLFNDVNVVKTFTRKQLHYLFSMAAKDRFFIFN